MMRMAIGIFLLLMALGVVISTLPPVAAFFALLSKRAIGNSLACLIAVLIQLTVGYFLVTTGLDFIHSPKQTTGVENVHQFIASLEAKNRATRVVNKGPGNAIMSSSDADEMMENLRLALAHAENVDPALLEKKYRGWGDHFEREYRAGLRLVVEGHETVDVLKSSSGKRLLDAWGNWFDAHIEDIRRLR